MRKDQSLAARLTAGAGAALIAAGLIADTVAAETALSSLSKEAGLVVEKLNQLGGRTLGQQVGKRNDATVILSPYGLGSALHLLLMGAASNSAAESSLKATLVPSSIDEARKGLQEVSKQITSPGSDKVKLTLASAVFVPETGAPSPGSRFKPRAAEVFKAKVEALDFKSPKAVDAVNGWVKQATNEQIPSIIEKLDPDARFVLLNAIYFNGAWKLAFDPARTAKAPFTLADKTTRQVAMMSATFPLALAELGSLQVVWLPYGGDDVAMLVIAPRANEAPTVVADALAKTSIDDLVAAARKEARERPVHVKLPRFRAESILDLTDALAGQIGRALAADSDYGPINNAKRGPLQVLHRAVLEVTETGTIAAAATAVTSDRSLAVTPVFAADRPFAFAIVHRPTQAVLFTGYIADPGDVAASEPTR